MDNLNYATFKLRLVAALIDAVLWFLFASLLFYYVMSRPSLSAIAPAALLSLIILLNPVVIFLPALCTWYFGGSFGKLFTGLRVTGENNKPLSFWRLMFRQTAGYMFSGTFFGLGFLSVIKDEKKQAWHDKAVGSYVTAKGNLFVIGLMLLILLFFMTIGVVKQSVKVFNKGPVMKEIQTYRKPEPAKFYSPSHNLPAISPYPKSEVYY